MGIISFGIEGGIIVGLKFIDVFKLILCLVNIGDVKFFVCYLVSIIYC